jgi:predicted negative regulator of RcsB-dependent stress response
MTMFDPGKNRLAGFESELACEVDDTHLDYNAIATALFRKIEDADELGPLASLKLRQIPSDSFFERVEEAIFQRITRYEEYEEPVDECINADADLPPNCWRTISENLNDAIDHAAELAPWETELKTDVIPTMGTWEKIEAGLDRRLDDCRTTRVKPAVFMLPFTRQTIFRVAAAITLLLLGAEVSYRLYDHFLTRLPTYVYQAHGVSMVNVTNTPNRSTIFGSAPGGALRLINEHASVQLSDGALLKVRSLSPENASYALSLAPPDAAGFPTGKATFLVKPHAKNHSFLLSTPEYSISVIGTYFRLLPDMNGKITTQVLEGVVTIKTSTQGTVFVRGGETFSYDFSSRQYIVKNNGPAVAQADLPVVPDINSLASSHPVSIDAETPLCDITVNDIYRGTTPLRLLVAAPTAHIIISKEGFRTLDTIINLARIGGTTFFTALQHAPIAPAVAGDTTANVPLPVVQTKSIRHLVKAIDTGDTSLGASRTTRAADANALLAKAQEAEKVDWRESVRLYEELMVSSASTTMIKQIALFSIGKLQVEAGHNADEAANAFLQYLALYPMGIFSCESLLRLAEIEFNRDQDKSLNYYLTYFAKYPAHSRVSELQHRVGLIYLQRKQYDDAIAMFKQSLANMPYDDRNTKMKLFEAIYRAMVTKGDSTQAQIFMRTYLSAAPGR